MSFLITREFVGDRGAVAEGPEREPFWHQPIFEADEQLPRFDGTLAGIRLGPDVDIRDRVSLCVDTADVVWVELDDPRASDLNAIPPNIPTAAEFQGGIAVICQGELVSVEAEWFVPPNPDQSFRGGIIQIYRFKGEPLFRGDYPSLRVDEVALGGLTGIELRPVQADGLGDSAILLREPWGLTTVRGTGFTTDDLRAFALGLYETGARP